MADKDNNENIKRPKSHYVGIATIAFMCLFWGLPSMANGDGFFDGIMRNLMGILEALVELWFLIFP